MATASVSFASPPLHSPNDALVGSPPPTATPVDGSGWKWWSSIRLGGSVGAGKQAQGVGSQQQPKTRDGSDSDQHLGAGSGGDPKRNASKVSLSHFFRGGGGGGGGGVGNEEGKEEEKPVDEEVEEEGPSDVDVDTLLWEAQLAFVNHRPGHAVGLLEKAAKLGSSHACLNLANVSLRQQSLNASDKKPSAPVPTPQTQAIQTQHDLRKGVHWLLQGLRIESVKASPAPSSTDDQDFGDEALQLDVVNDLAQGLTTLYRYGKLKPPHQEVQNAPLPHKNDTRHLWNEGADLAAKLVEHPSIKIEVDSHPTGYFDSVAPTWSCGVGSPSASKDPSCKEGKCAHLDQESRLRRSCNVHLFYLLALSRFPFASPPTPSAPTSPADFAPSTPVNSAPPTSQPSANTHWGHSEAQRYWSRILFVSRLPGGVGTREGEAIVLKAQRRLGLLHDAERNGSVFTPGGEEHPAHGHVLAHHQSPESSDGSFLQSPTMGHSASSRVKATRKASSASSSSIKLRANRQGSLGMSPAQEIVQKVKTADVVTAEPAEMDPPMSTTPTASSSKLAFPTKAAAAEEAPVVPALERLRGKHRSRPRLRSTLSRDIFLGDRERTYSAPAVPTLSTVTRAATTFVSIEHAGLHDSKGKSVPGRQQSLGLSPSPSTHGLADSVSGGFSRRMRNDSFASLASFDAPFIMSTASALPSTTAHVGFRKRVGSTASSIRSWRPSLPTLTPRSAPAPKPAVEVLERALRKDADARMGWTWAEMDPENFEDDETEGEGDSKEDAGVDQSSPRAGSEEPTSDSTLASQSTVPTSVPTSASTSTRHIAQPLNSSPSSKKGKIFVPIAAARQPLTAPGTPRATRERRALDHKRVASAMSSSALLPLTAGKRKGDHSGTGSSESEAESAITGLKSRGSMDPLLAALEEQSRVNVKARCAVCGRSGINFPKCPKCDKTFCSRDCRVSAEGGGDGLRHVCRSQTASPASMATPKMLSSPPLPALVAT